MLHAPEDTEILVVRHAEVHNPTDIVYGRLPRFGLSTRGREQAALTAQFLEARSLTALYTSPMLRARQTAEIIAARQASDMVHVLSDLIEVRTSYQGQPNSILKPGFSFYEPVADPTDESMMQVRDRMLSVLRRLARRHPGKRVAMVSHADPIAILRLGLEGKPLTSERLHATVYPARASVTCVRLRAADVYWLSYFDIVGDGPT